MHLKYFGTDGIRGPYGGPLINETFAWRLGYAAACWHSAREASPGRVALIGRDTRTSGISLERALAAGLAAGGLSPVSMGVVPTPVVSHGVRHERAALGVVITASHNPAPDNGIKFFNAEGMKLTDPDEAEIEARLPAAAGAPDCNLGAHDILPDYRKVVGRILAPHSLRGWKITLDTANGATCATSPVVLRTLGAEVACLGDAPDGTNINAGVGSEYPGPLGELVRAHGARLGIAHDGDGDRCILCDEQGCVLDGDDILAILALHALEQGRLSQRVLVVTEQSNRGVDAAVRSAGGRVLRTPVGDRQVLARMLAEGATLGGESSGHIICAEVAPTGDGLVAALKVISVMQESGRPLSQLRAALIKFPQMTATLSVQEKRPLEQLAMLQDEIKAIEHELGSSGRVRVRYSGTEPKLRLLVEAQSEELVANSLERLRRAALAEGITG